jgi:AcrR family transcriptional regulator
VARAGLTAERITEAAAELADEVGLDNVTVTAVARKFGVKDASLYSHLKNVQDLRERLAELALTEMADRAAEVLAGRSGKDALVAFADNYRNYAKQHPGRYAAAQLPLDQPSPVARRHSELTRALLRGYDLQEPDQTDAIRLLHSTFHGYVTLETAGAFRHTPRDVDASWTRTLDALDALLRALPST